MKRDLMFFGALFLGVAIGTPDLPLKALFFAGAAVFALALSRSKSAW